MVKGIYNRTEKNIENLRKSKLGIKNPMWGKHHTEEWKEKIRKTAKNNFNYGMKNKSHSEEVKEKIRLNKLEYFKTHEHPMLDKKHSSITRIKISNSNKGRTVWNKDKRGIYSKETINKIKEARNKQILPVKDTSIEIKIQNFLKQLGIEFFTHQYIKIEHSYQCDILIPSMKLVIECDGDYWHKYPIGNDIDHIRTSELLEKGFKVLRLWEFEINNMRLNDFKILLEGGFKIL